MRRFSKVTIAINLMAILLVISLSGCARHTVKEQVEKVAKDWSHTIRASQVIPIYPLSEDLQPGDVFLVTRTVDQQHKAYEGKGFLELDNHIARLDVSDLYPQHYKNSFLDDPYDTDTRYPGHWLLPQTQPAKEKTDASEKTSTKMKLIVAEKSDEETDATLKKVKEETEATIKKVNTKTEAAIKDIKTKAASTQDKVKAEIKTTVSKIEDETTKANAELYADGKAGIEKITEHIKDANKEVKAKGEEAIEEIRNKTNAKIKELATEASSAIKKLKGPTKKIDLAWTHAPNASFPSYTVSADIGAGFSASFPVKAIPVGLTLMNTSSANVTVELSQAKTIGLPILEINQKLEDAYKKEHDSKQLGSILNSDVLGEYYNEKCPNYIRTINRIYLIKEISVTINDANQTNFGASAGAGKPVELLFPGNNPDKDALNQYTTNVSQLNKSLNSGVDGLLKNIDQAGNFLPGGSLRVVSASSRGIAMRETFDRPLVIGYLAFDREILEDGSLGAPIPTLALVTKKVSPELVRYREGIHSKYLKLVKKINNSEQSKAIYENTIIRIDGDTEKFKLYLVNNKDYAVNGFSYLTELLRDKKITLKELYKYLVYFEQNIK